MSNVFSELERADSEIMQVARQLASRRLGMNDPPMDERHHEIETVTYLGDEVFVKALANAQCECELQAAAQQILEMILNRLEAKLAALDN